MSFLFQETSPGPRAPTQGRRAMEEPTSPNSDTMLAETTTPPSEEPDVQRPAPKQGGWSEGAGQAEDPRLRDTTSTTELEVMSSIPVLEELAEEDMSFQVAEAPNIQVNRVTTIRELDQELHKHSALMTLDNKIDLKILARVLSAEKAVKEEDKPWHWDRLFTEVASELNTEWETLNPDKDGTISR